MRPLVGVTAYYIKAYEIETNRPRGLPGQNMLMSTIDYYRSLQSAGGTAVAVPLINEDIYIEALTDKLDGFLFAGGLNVSPLKYNQAIQKGAGKIMPERDEFELKLLEKVLEKDKPVFAICKGIQLLNVFFGGTLYQDVEKARLSQINHACEDIVPKYAQCHKVILSQPSLVFDAFNKKELWVNSFHHQAIDKLGDGLIATAVSEDGLIEAVEHKDYNCVFAVQWHPEMMADVHAEQLGLFRVFVEKTKK